MAADTRQYEIQLVSLLKSIGRALGGSSSSLSGTSSSSSSTSSTQIADAIRGVSKKVGNCYNTLSSIVGGGVPPEPEEESE